MDDKLPVSNGVNGSTNGISEGQRRYVGIGSMEQMEAMWEAEKNIEEIKKIDDQMSSLNSFMDRVEKASDSMTEKLKTLLDQQKAEREERKAILAQRQEEMLQSQSGIHSQVQSLLSRARQAHQTPPPPLADNDPAVERLIELTRKTSMAKKEEIPADPPASDGLHIQLNSLLSQARQQVRATAVAPHLEISTDPAVEQILERSRRARKESGQNDAE